MKEITIEQAEQTYKQNFEPITWFERAIFLGWHCSLGDCEFCFMSTQKNIASKKPKIRSLPSILAEVMICNAQGWKIEFLSAGYDAISFEQLLKTVKAIKQIYPDELWLNVGVLTKEQLSQLKSYIAGINGSIECINTEIRKKVCPSKNLEDIEQMFKDCEELGLKKSITIIIGLGETKDDQPKLKQFIEKHNINRITFYSLTPHKGTPFKESPELIYYSSWIKYIRIHFPKLIVISGIWKDRTDQVSTLLKAGANAITKFPAIKMFNSAEAKEIHKQAEISQRLFKGSLVDKQNINKEATIKENFLSVEENTILRSRLDQYIILMSKN